MDEQRQQAYLNLIRSLLNCPRGEENKILQANSELVDAGLVQVMLEEANNLRIDNNLDDANSLMTLAGHLMGTYGNTMPDKSSPSTYLTFLTEVLQVTADNKADRNVIYAILRENIKLINDNLAVVLRNWAKETLPNSDSQRRISLTTLIGNFCNAIREFPLGSRASNLEIAIAGDEIALTVFTRQEYAKDWAMTQSNLGNDYGGRIRGEKAENLELAIDAFVASLEIYTREVFPQNWAGTKNNLGIAYGDRIRGEKAENLELAIAAYLASLEIYTREVFPQYWAMTQNNLGIAYRNRIKGETDQNLELAIAAYLASLEIYTREAFPQNWAGTKNNLGNAYSDRIKGETDQNLELAIAAYLASLEIYTPKVFPQYWADTQNNLGNAYRYRIRGEKAENLERAIAAFLASLEIRTRAAFPINNVETLYNLGLANQENSQLPEAYNSFKTAIETVESMRSEIIIGGEADRQKLAEEWNKLYQDMVEVCLQMENKTAALEYIERSKTRNLVELFHKSRNLPQNVQRISFQEIRSLLGEDEAILEWYISQESFKVFTITRDSTQPDVWESLYQDLQALEEFQQEYIDDYINQPENWRNQLETRLEKLAKILHIDKIISHLPKNCQRLILVPFRYLHLLPLHALTSRRLRQNVEETGSLLELFPGGVRYTPSCQLLQLSQRVNPTGEESSPTRLFAIQNPTEDLDFTDIEVEAIAKSFNPAEVLIREKASKTGLQQQLAALQNADIAHFSCHGFFDFSNPRKSALILAGAKITPLNPPLPRGETGEDFPLRRGETGEDFPLPCGEIGEDFPLVNGETGEDFPLVNGETGEVPPLTKGGLGGVSSDKSYIRSRRGETFDIAECLTLEEIFDFRLSKCSLVTLSACETGLTDIRDNTDEYIGLPSGFFYAGATSVISTLWAVNDVSTAILMIKFYEIFLSETRPPVAIALRESQLWLKEATVQDLVDWVASCKLISDESKEEMQNSIKFAQRPENKRYQSPYFWAAFCAIGQ
ncbi:CHAT domain-containing protein [Microcoleus sp. OTE_8_concoct_300]|uniref:CHAT domain-containing protein n=1 Tax=Microcoleus sp. OTE_8_concoct_300 TaxID=2964710 RepID=UPI00403F0EE6